MEIEKAKMMSLDLTQESIKKIREIFPNVVTEVKDDEGKVKLAIDFDTLKQELSDALVSDKQERFHLAWPDKKLSIISSNKSTSSTLRPLITKSKDFFNTNNIYIEGDNLEALKALRETYLGKIRVIYIDPPYNTGNDFIYNDNFTASSEEYIENTDQIDSEGNRLVHNTESNGRFHTDWLNMMYPRLKIARDLLTDDGAIFVSIDEHEHANLLMLMNEIFGQSNYIDSIVWDKKTGAKGVPPRNMMVNVHEYIVAYQKTGDFSFVGEERNAELDGFKNPDNDPRGPWRVSNIKSTTKPIEEAFTIVDPNTGKEYTNTWAFSKERLEQMIKEGRILWKDTLPKQKEYLYEMTNENKAIKSSWGVFDAQSTTVFLKKLMPKVHFDNPKPINLMKYLIKVCTKKDDIVMDFFSGSGTTAQAIMEVNSEDGGARQFILIQLPEACDKDSEAYKDGFLSICDIGETRIDKAGDIIKNEAGLIGGNLDIGFRTLKIDSSNVNDIYYNPKAMTQNLLEATVDNIKPDRTALDLLFQVMLECGALLSSKIEEKEINGKKVYVVEDNYIAACFDDEVDDKTVEAIAKLKPIYACFKGSSFNSDSANINAEQIFKTYSPNTEKIKVI